MREQTFGLIKTGAIARCQVGAIYTRIQEAGLRMVEAGAFGSVYHADALGLFRELYAEHFGRPYYGDLIRSVSLNSTAIVLEGDGAVTRWRDLMGPTDPAIARRTHPRSLRALYGGQALPDNAVHGSDSVAAARREIAIFFRDVTEAA